MDATAEQLASLVGLSSAAVSTLARRGVMIRGERGKFNLEASVRAYCAHLRSAAAGRGNGTEPTAQSTQRARLARGQADAIELKNAARRGALVDAETVAREWEGICRMLRAGMLRVPKRATARLPNLTAQDVRSLDIEIRAVLNELGIKSDAW
jgi:phage terminase Nu1 subunit (DNA packaging protein)